MAESQELYDAASGPQSLWIVEGAGHQDFLAYDPRGYDAHVVEFLIETLVVSNTSDRGVLADVSKTARRLVIFSCAIGLLGRCEADARDRVFVDQNYIWSSGNPGYDRDAYDMRTNLALRGKG